MHAAQPSPLEAMNPPSRRSLAWGGVVVGPLILGAIAAAVGSGADAGLPATWIGAVVIALALTAAYIDGRWQRLPNWLTYSAAAWGLGLNALASSLGPEGAWIGGVGFAASLAGFAALFLVMLIMFSLTGGGAGDVKLAGAIGALIGLELGATALMYSFIAAGLWVFAMAIWRLGPVVFGKLVLRQFAALLFRGWVPAWLVPTDPDRERATLRAPVALGPFFAIGLLLTIAGA